MKAIAFSGSAKKGGNTAFMLKTVLEELDREKIQTELIELADEEIKPCTACYKCFKNKDKKCVIKDDNLNQYIEKLIESDIIILGSPVYLVDITPKLIAFMERCGMVSIANKYLLRRKIGAGVVVRYRRAGAIHGLDSINHFFLVEQMIVVGSNYLNIGVGRGSEAVSVSEEEIDEEGVKTMIDLAHNIAWLAKEKYQ
ncbi:NADPH-dependent FMN reductase [Thermodesulfobium narugense DSM 14796]|uniref:NADPH-dependent FMN reductase n=1 Tax=Thermodesulfobium narugense DSM 14796 TaxID=747365 RepID=M1E6H9_9BACT|nr:flavodoxin family protein [Thermodesulfobium narugense]AEE14020.1 NADPH-dependent FMN reductase [Thermodesulfobium narugense DSM 14796]